MTMNDTGTNPSARPTPVGLLTSCMRGRDLQRALLDAWIGGDVAVMTSRSEATRVWVDALWVALAERLPQAGRAAALNVRTLARHGHDVARTVAVAAYLEGWLAYTATPRATRPLEARPSVELAALLARPFQRVARRTRVAPAKAGRMALMRVTAAYRRDLALSRTAAVDQDLAALLRVGRSAWRRLPDELASAAREVDGEAERVRFAWWLRRRATSLAALVLMAARLIEPRAASGLAQAAKRRSALVRSAWTFERAPRGARAPGVAERGLLGTIASLAYDEAEGETDASVPVKRRAHAVLESGQRVEVPFKHLAAHGATEGAALWLRGKVTPTMFEVEQEGLRAHARTVWEDYLAELARPAFDLAPGSIFAEWELPSRSAKRRATDLLARIRGRATRSDA